MSRPLWLLHLIKRAFPGRFLAARATHVPLLGRMVDRWLFEGDDLIYLPRDRVIEIRQSIALPDEMVLHLFYEAQSGRAYTPENERNVRTGKLYSKNARVEHRVDVKAQRTWRFSGFKLISTLEVRNLFDYRSPRRIDPSTGELPTDGVGQYSDPVTGSSQVFRDALLSNPSRLTSPRQTRVGFGLAW